MLLVIDVGNSNNVIGLFSNQKLLTHWRIRTEWNRTADEYWVLINTDFTEQYVRSTQEAINQTGLEREIPGLIIKLTGSLIVRLEENEFIKEDLKKSAVSGACMGFNCSKTTTSGPDPPVLATTSLNSLINGKS